MKFCKILFLPLLPFKTVYYWKKSGKANLPGRKFATYGFFVGFKLLIRGKISLKLLLNPVSIVRYFEFDYVYSNIKKENKINLLDISSPYLFGFFLSNKIDCKYIYTNPDERDLSNVTSLSNKLGIKNYSAEKQDARKLEFDSGSFNVVLSISVIEHIDEDGDSEVMKEMWRVLKPGGILILTFPVSKNYSIEYRDADIYNLNYSNEGEKYFFQRIYDDEEIKKRLLSSIDNFEIIYKVVFGETTENFYSEYKKRWIKNGYWETVKDPYYITEYFKYYNSLHELKNLGVMGLTIRKLK